jgi:peptidyl-prolyl cis-trans isomerase D
VSRDQREKLETELLNAALRADTKKLPAWVGVDLSAGGYAVIRVNKVVARNEAEQASAKTDREQYTQMWTAAEVQAYFTLLRNQLKVEMLVPEPKLGFDRSAG